MEAGNSDLTETSEGNKMEDTVTLARQEREKQGLWEAEVSYGEADLHQHLSDCDKNPGHQNFIPVGQFNVNNLTSGWHDNNIVDLVRTMSDLTVRVSVMYVSDSRPETVPGSDEPFPCYKNRSRDMLRTGTGWVYAVNIYPNKDDKHYAICECKECVNSNTQKTQFAHIDIRTAAHLVYDDLEAAHTTCHLFFDYGSTPADCDGVVTLTGLSVVRCNLDRDLCHVRYTTHDLDLARRINKIKSQFQNLSIRYGLKCALPHIPDRHCEKLLHRHLLSYNNPDNRLTIIVSHPHGCSKQVSLGRCTHFEQSKYGLIKYTYTTPACPGSSGAHAFAMDNKMEDTVTLARQERKKQDFVDECNPPNLWCTGGVCLGPDEQCDTRSDCFDGSDEANCPTDCTGVNQLLCNNGKCIPKDQECDRRNDCGDNTDETDCAAISDADCKATPGFRCRNGICLHKYHRCDGVNDCGDNSDEKKCPAPPCMMDSDPKQCDSSKKMWYFDRVLGTCKIFSFGWCAGTDNKFKSKKACMKTCGVKN